MNYNNEVRLTPQVAEGMVRDRFAIKAHSGKSLFNLSSPTGVLLLETRGMYNMCILANISWPLRSQPAVNSTMLYELFKPEFVTFCCLIFP